MTDMTGVAKECFQVLLRYDYVVKLFDEDGMTVAEPTEARRMFATSPNLMVSLTDADDNSNIKLLFGKSTHASDIDGLIQALRTTATKYNVTFEPKKFGSEINAKNYKSLVSVSESYKDIDMHVCEGMYGTSRSSYLSLDHARMIVHHKAPINVKLTDGRARQIDAIFVENAAGDRFQIASTNLAMARKMAEHVNTGGNISDTKGKAILAEAKRNGPKCFPDQPPKGSPPYLAENNPVVQSFLQWTEKFAPDRALLEYGDDFERGGQKYGDPGRMAIDSFDPREFMASDIYENMLSGRGPMGNTSTMGDPDLAEEDNHVAKDEVMDALNHYLRTFIEMHHPDHSYGYNEDTEALASEVYDQTVGALHQAGLIVDDNEMMEADGLEMENPGTELTREDILLPNPNQGAGLARATSKSVVKDDPSNPDEEHLPGQFSDPSRLKTLAGMARPL